MLRRLLFCALLGVFAWTTGHLLAHDGSACAASAQSTLSSAGQDSSQPDQVWIAGRRFAASTTESGWRVQLQYVSVAPFDDAIVFDSTRRNGIASRPLRHAPDLPSFIPLLI